MRDLEHHLDNKTHVIWDWNGTLLNDIEMCVDIISGLLTRYGYPAITVEEYRARFRFPVRDYYREIGFDLEKISFEDLTREFIGTYNARVAECRLFRGTPELLDRLNERGMTHSVLSAAHEGDLRRLLGDHNLTEHFLHIYGLGDHYAASKTERGRQLTQALHVPKEEIIMIGDTDHDVEVARAMGVDIMLFGDGHQCPTRLIKAHSRVILRCEKGGPVQQYQP